MTRIFPDSAHAKEHLRPRSDIHNELQQNLSYNLPSNPSISITISNTTNNPTPKPPPHPSSFQMHPNPLNPIFLTQASKSRNQTDSSEIQFFSLPISHLIFPPPLTTKGNCLFFDYHMFIACVTTIFHIDLLGLTFSVLRENRR